MPDVFGEMATALFADPNFGESATYRAGGVGPGRPVRVLRTAPAGDFAAGATVIRRSAVGFEVLKSEVPQPQARDTLEAPNPETGAVELFRVQTVPESTQARVWVLDVTRVRS
jgi:hypothetical protein